MADTFTLTGTYKAHAQAPWRGTVTIVAEGVGPNSIVKDGNGDVVFAGASTVDLDAGGSFSVTLPDPNDTSLNPNGFGYTVTARLHRDPGHIRSTVGPDTIDPSQITAGTTLDMSDVVAVDPSTLDPDPGYVEIDSLAINVMDHGAVGDGVANDTLAVQPALDKGSPVYLPPGRYLCDDLVMHTDSVLHGAGDASVLYFPETDTDAAHHFIRNADQTNPGAGTWTNENITLYNFRIEGASGGGPTGTPSSPGVTVLFKFCKNVVIDHVSFFQTIGPCMQVQGSKHIRLLNNRVEDCGRGGLVCVSINDHPAEDVTIVGNVVDGVGDDGIALNAVATGVPLVQRATVVGNTVNGRNQTDDGGRGILLLGVEDVTVGGNIVEQTWARGIAVNPHGDGSGTRSRDVALSGNVVRTAGDPNSTESKQGIFLHETDGVVLGPNSVTDTDGPGLFITECTEVEGGPIRVQGSTSSSSGVQISNSSQIDVEVHSFRNEGVGVYVVNNATDVTLTGEAYDNAQAGSLNTNDSGVRINTTGRVTLNGFVSKDNQSTKTQQHGLVINTNTPESVIINGGDYSGNNSAIGVRVINEPTTFITRGVLESTTDWRNADRTIAGTHHIAAAGDPEGVVAAPVGSTYARSDGGAGTSLYVKESGTGNTGWVGK